MGVLVQILAEVLSLLGLTNTLVSLVTNLYNLAANFAKEHIPYQIESTVVSTSLNVANPTYGLAALKTLIDTNQLALLAAIGNPQQAGVPVTLPAVPPAGYGGASAAAVWAFDVSGVGATGGDAATALWVSRIALINRQTYTAYRMNSSPLFSLAADVANLNISGPQIPPPVADTRGALAGDTVLSWLTRVAPGFAWQHLDFSGTGSANANVGAFVGGSHQYYILCNLTDADLAAQVAARTPAVTAPIWPGIASVTLGAAVAFGPATTGLTVFGPMDGVIVAISAWPANVAGYLYDTERSLIHAGGLVFQDDHGQDEVVQALGPLSAIYVPKTMFQAAKVSFRFISGLTGTITPWTAT